MRFGVLGALLVETDGGHLPVNSPQQRALLAALLVEAGRPVPVAALIEHIWQEAPPANARTALQVRILRLRKLLADDDATVVTRQQGYALHLTDPSDLDLHRFNDLVTRAGREPDLPTRATLLRQALDEWRGPALADVDTPSLRDVAVGLDERRMTVLEQRVDADLALGRHQELIPELRALTLAHPLHEAFGARLIQALAAAGQRSAALDVYQRMRDRLADELGVDPGPQLQAVHLQVLRSGSEAPAAGEAWAAPAMLPADVPDFTGRGDEIQELRSILSGTNGALSIAAVTGMGGAGKSTLAVHVAHAVRDSYPDGQIFVNLQGAEATALDPADVLVRLLNALGVPSRGVPGDPAERAGLYRSRLAGRRVLVVLDNAANEAQVRPLLPGDGTCAVLVTSRNRLTGLEGARRLELGVLESSQAAGLFGQVAGPGRLDGEQAAVAEVVRLCGGLPLALRIAAARLAARPTWSVGHLARLLGDEHRRLDRLSSGDLGVRASLMLSYQGLAAEPQRLFRLIGAFDAPDLPEWLAAALLGGHYDDAVEHLEALVDAQLLQINGTDAAGSSRYQLHDLVRLYSRSLGDNTPAVFETGLGGWLALAENMCQWIPGPCYAPVHGDAPRTGFDGFERVLAGDPMAWFDAEHRALVATVRQACDAGLHEAAFDLAGCLEKYFDIRGMYPEWLVVNERVLRICRTAGNKRGEAVMMRGLIDIRTWVSDQPQASAMANMHTDALILLDLFRDAGSEAGMSDATVMISWAHAAKADYAAAEESARAALALAERSGHLGGRARAQVALAIALGEAGNLGPSLAALREGLGLARELGNPRYEATVQQFLGIAYTRGGALESAERALTASMDIFHRYHDDYAETLSRLMLARVYAAQADARAHALATEAVTTSRRLKMTHHLADALTVLGEIELSTGAVTAARTHLAESVALWRERGWPNFLAGALDALGKACAAALDEPAARACWREARDLYTHIGNHTRASELDRRLDTPVL